MAVRTKTLVNADLLDADAVGAFERAVAPIGHEPSNWCGGRFFMLTRRPGVPSQHELRDRLMAGPVLICFEASASTGHTVLAVGLQSGIDVLDPMVVVNDPQPPPGRQRLVSYSFLVDGMGLHSAPACITFEAIRS